MSTLPEIRQLKSLCDQYALDGREILATHTDEELAALYNGIGPESFPDWLRNVLDAVHPSLAPVALIHDIEWSASDGTAETFAASNERFKTNGYKIAKGLYAWWRPRRYLVMNDARRFGNLCQHFGWAAWRAPYEAAKSEATPAEAAQAAATVPCSRACAMVILAILAQTLTGCATLAPYWATCKNAALSWTVGHVCDKLTNAETAAPTATPSDPSTEP